MVHVETGSIMSIIASIQTLMSVLDIFSGQSINTIISDTIVTQMSEAVPEYEFPRAQIEWSNALARDKFPENFSFGVATSAYQTEGAWNISGKGESVWDYSTHSYPFNIFDDNADVSADSYHKYKEDIRLAKTIGSKMFRISISWSRILPNGYSDYINPDAIQHYNDVINEMLANGMEPVVTLYHWDLPNSLQQIGGWTNSMMPDIFAAYARIAFANFGDRVKYWITINEPSIMCTESYGGTSLFPGLNQSGIADYMCGHNVLLAHSRAYKVYNNEFREAQNGKVSIAHRLQWFVPINSSSEEDIATAERAHQWYNEWFLHPIFSETGDYPLLMKKQIAINSFVSGFQYSRLPKLSTFEANEIRGTSDFLAINYYSATFVQASTVDITEVSFDNDIAADLVSFDKNSDRNFELQNTPWALRDGLRRLHNDYNSFDIFITGIGYSDSGDVLDIGRVKYYHQHLSAVLRAMKEGIKVRSFLASSLLDSFEWTAGYLEKTGVFSVDFENDDRPRAPKLSSQLLTSVYRTGTLPDVKLFLYRKVAKKTIILMFPMIPIS